MPLLRPSRPSAPSVGGLGAQGARVALLFTASLTGSGCLRPPETGACVDPVVEAWTAVTEPELRFSEADAAWATDEGATLDTEPAEGCAAPPCVAVRGGSARTELVLNRAEPYTLGGTLWSDLGGTLRLTQLTEDGDLVGIAAVEVGAGQAVPLSTSFELEAAGSTLTLSLEPAEGATLAWDEASVTGEQWAMGEGGGEGTLDWVVLVHVEASSRFAGDEAYWRVKAEVLEGLARTLAAHGGGLAVQADIDFLSAADTWDAAFVPRMEGLGVSWSLHFHVVSDDADEFERLLDGAVAWWVGHGRSPTDLNGGFGVGRWELAAERGLRSLTAYKGAEDQSELPGESVSPWRPADDASTADAAGFMVDDPEGSLVYLPGRGGREADHRRVPAFYARHLSQALDHTRGHTVNVSYIVEHVDSFGPEDVDALRTWIDEGGLDADLAWYDEALRESVDPAVDAGRLRWSSPAAVAERFRAQREGCDGP